MKKTIILALCLSYFTPMLLSQNAPLFTKNIPLPTKGNFYSEPLIIQGNKGETILIYIKTASFKSPSFITIVVDKNWNKIYEKETSTKDEVFAMMLPIQLNRGRLGTGILMEKMGIQVKLFQMIDYGDEVGIFYERNAEIAYLTLSKKDYSLIQNNTIKVTKIPTSIFSKNMQIIKAFPFENKLYALFAGKEDNQLIIATIDKEGQVTYNAMNMPTLSLDKGNGKSKNVEFTKYDNFDWKGDSLFSFVYKADNDSKYFHTILVNIIQKKARVLKYKYPVIRNNKNEDIYRGVLMTKDKLILSSAGAEECVISILDRRMGNELKNILVRYGTNNVYQNTPIVEREETFAASFSIESPESIKIEDGKDEKFWKKFAKGGYHGLKLVMGTTDGTKEENIGAISIDSIDNVYRISIGFSEKYEYYSTSISSTPSKDYNYKDYYLKHNTMFFDSYFDNNFEHIKDKKTSAYEQAIKEAELRNKKKIETLGMKSFMKDNINYTIYTDLAKRQIVIIGSGK